MINNSFNQEQLNNHIKAIAAALKAEPVQRFNDGRYTVIQFDSDESGIFVHYDSRKHVLHLSGLWPAVRKPGAGYHATYSPQSHLHPVPADTSINVSAAKSAEQIARDIERRFLPAYREVFARLIEKRQRDEDYAAREKSLADSIAKSLGATRGPNGQKAVFDLPANLTAGSSYGNIEVTGDTVRFEVRNLEADRALQLIRFLKEL